MDKLTKSANLSDVLVAQLARLEERTADCADFHEPGFAFGGEYAIVARLRQRQQEEGGARLMAPPRSMKCPAAIAGLSRPPMSVDEFHRSMLASAGSNDGR